jgi:hypothetical protein
VIGRTDFGIFGHLQPLSATDSAPILARRVSSSKPIRNKVVCRKGSAQSNHGILGEDDLGVLFSHIADPHISDLDDQPRPRLTRTPHIERPRHLPPG